VQRVNEPPEPGIYIEGQRSASIEELVLAPRRTPVSTLADVPTKVSQTLP